MLRLILVLVFCALLLGCAGKTAQTGFGISQSRAQELAWEAGKQLYLKGSRSVALNGCTRFCPPPRLISKIS
jgi:hypothetical protein